VQTKAVIVALLVATVLWLGSARHSWGEVQSFDVVMTAYTCEPHPQNPMHPCGRLRWGGDLNSPGMACPPEWRNRLFDVPGSGVRRCDDTGRYDYLAGLPHIDVRVPTLAEARQRGVQRVTITAVDEAQPTPTPAPPTPAPASAALPSEAAAIAQAQALTPGGDPTSAMARLVQAERARATFPALLAGLNGPANQPVWLVTMWAPAETFPAGAVAQPDPAAPIAARFFVFDALTGAEVSSAYVSRETLDLMGWLAQDAISLTP
jgi:hypothetical protein